MPVEVGPLLVQPDRHPFPTFWKLEGSLDDVRIAFFWVEPVSLAARKLFEKTLLDKSDELVNKNLLHYLDDEFKWRSRTRPKGVPITTPRANKVAVYGDFVTNHQKGLTKDEDIIEPIHLLLDSFHDFKPPLSEVRIEIG